MTDPFLPNASIDSLRGRAKLLSRIRAFFDERGFFEVQTPTLSRDTVVDRFIDPAALSLNVPGEGQTTFFLQTSPEFGMKRLLAAGADAIYQIGPAYRMDEVGELHNLEFIMLEWYRVGDNYQQGMSLLDELAQELLGCPPATRITWWDAAKQFCSDLETQLQRTDVGDPCEHVFGEFIEPGLATFPSVIIHDWPHQQSALARVRNDSPPVAERFELYVHGIELANGYHELTDAQELESRSRQNNQQRVQAGRPELPVESKLLQAMRHGLPDCCGVALGVDRLVMIALGKRRIREVMTFDSRRA